MRHGPTAPEAAELRDRRALPYPRLAAYYERCHARPAWHRTLGLYAERFGVSVEQIR